jgi:hypothetical protein
VRRYQAPRCSICGYEVCAGFVVDGTSEIVCTTCLCMAQRPEGRETLSMSRVFLRLRRALRRVPA